MKQSNCRLTGSLQSKVLQPSINLNTNTLKRFQQEAKSVATLSHPNIISVYAFSLKTAAANFQGVVAEIFTHLSVLYRLEGDIDKAREAFGIAGQFGGGTKSPELQGLLHRYSAGLRSRGHIDQARGIEEWAESLKMRSN